MRIRWFSSAWVGAAALALLPSCELLGLQLDADCTSSQPTTACAGLNHRFSIADDACERWYCHEQACVFGPADRDDDGAADATVCSTGTDCDDADPTRNPAATETCDGVDQDCDAWVDESTDGRIAALTADGDAPTVDPSNGLDDVELTLGITGPSYAEVERTSPTGVEVVHARVRVLDVRSDTVAPATSGAGPHEAAWSWDEFQISTDSFVRSASATCPSVVPLTASTPAWGCDVSTTTRSNGTVDALVLDALPGSGWLAAAIDTSICAAGRLRVGLVESASLAASAPIATHGGPHDAATGVPISNVWLGVDLDASACTGVSTTVAGAHAPAVLAVPGSTSYRGHALVAYRAGARPTADCGAPDGDVLALGLFAEERTSGASYLSAEGDGTPRRLGAGTGSAPPALAFVESDGTHPGAYYVAFTASDGVHVVRIDEPMQAPPLYTGTARTIPSFGATTPVAIVPATGAEDVTLVAHTFDAAGGLTTLLGLAWREGCATNRIGTIAAGGVRIDADGTSHVLSRVEVAPAGITPSIAVIGTGASDRGTLVVAFVPPLRGQVMGAHVALAADMASLVPDAPRALYERTSADVRAAMLRTLSTTRAALPEVPYLLVVDDTRPLLGGVLQCAPGGR